MNLRNKLAVKRIQFIRNRFFRNLARTCQKINIFKFIAKFIWQQELACEYCGKLGGFQDSVCSIYGHTCWKCLERLKNEFRFCHDNCNFLCPKEIDQTEKKEPHHCFIYDKILKHDGHHPHIIACEKCKELSVPKEFYND